ncbi:MAG TPA: efflux RND transporter periplasmic adaptor subunit [Polyangiaceae bacterium]|nr:efflux RND transporter periplasmic adaptor subunit [Polyangiaceae bacterium]
MNSTAETHDLQQPRLVIPERVLQRSGARRNLVLLLAILATGIVAFIVWSRQPEGGPTYRTTQLSRRTITRSVEANGQLDVLNRVEVPASITGQLATILATPGMEVRAGQVLAELETTGAGLQVQNAKAAQQAASGRIAEAQAALEAARDTLARVERLSARGLVSEQELASARSQEAQARAAVRALRGEGAVAAGGVRSAELAKDHAVIRAPADGVVLVAPPWRGAVVSPEKGPLFVIGGSLISMRIDVSVAESDIGEVKVGQHASFSVPAFAGRTFEAEVDRVQIEPRRDRTVVTYPVTLRAKNPDRILLPGMTATVRIEVAEARDALVVREAALRFTPPDEEPGPPRSRLWLSPNGKRVEAVEIEPGLSDGAYTEVRPKQGNHLQAGDWIALGMAKGEGEHGSGPGISLGGKK